jgi:HK97 family phage prohead protease
MTTIETEPVDEAPPRAPLEFRLAPSQLLEVRYEQRTIELVIMPYDTDTTVFAGGRWVTESIAPGAFEGVERRANRIKVNRDHDVTRTVGRVVALHPSRAEGLVGELKIGRSALGDETLEYAADGILDASAGFAPFPGGEHYLDQRARRRITKAYLGHVALVPEPAYADARVLSVRHAELEAPATPATPNLDQVRLWALEAAYDAGHRSSGLFH